MATNRETVNVASILAGAKNVGEIDTIFENVPRRVTGVFVGNNTRGLIFHLTLNSQPLISMDCSEFDSTHGIVPVDIRYDVNIRIGFIINNTTGSTVSSVPINIEFQT